MKRVKLKLNSDSYHLSAVGYLYAAPAPPSDPPGMRPFSIRNTVFPEFDLEPGDYVLRFWVKNGEGRFDLLAFDPKSNQSTRKGYDTGTDGFEGLVFQFQVAP